MPRRERGRRREPGDATRDRNDVDLGALATNDDRLEMTDDGSGNDREQTTEARATPAPTGQAEGGSDDGPENDLFARFESSGRERDRARARASRRWLGKRRSTRSRAKARARAPRSGRSSSMDVARTTPDGRSSRDYPVVVPLERSRAEALLRRRWGNDAANANYAIRRSSYRETEEVGCGPRLRLRRVEGNHAAVAGGRQTRSERQGFEQRGSRTKRLGLAPPARSQRLLQTRGGAGPA